jgi:hypothetical protein
MSITERSRLVNHFEHRHGLRLQNADDRAYDALLNDLIEPVNVPSIAELEDAGDRFAFETRVSAYEGE